uniref:uncharacterized protein si:ch1073-126c3.2 n=1 Tax=Epinephelus lanceolatus TaxID=310571 RepID=UPI001444EB48|nr:uncharacterized protein si:ch1073-126c3.2 [Epinephelus lanceolatus]
MALQGTLIWFCSLAVLSSAAPQHESLPQNCTSSGQLLEHLKVAVENSESLTSEWSAQETAQILLTLRSLNDILHQHQLKGCQDAEPKKCPEAKVPENGGLICVRVANNSYCKPLCSHGYDFGFLRRSRIYEECTEQTGFKWRTQYIGGNTLAVCNAAALQISGASTAYFPKDQDCLTTKSNSQLQSSIIDVFITELKGQGIQADSQSACLVCG